MENAVDALKIAFAVFVFVIALSITMYMFTMAKETSDLVLQASDVTEYMEYTELNAVSDISNDRIVGLETVIPTLYKYYDENYTVIFRNSNGTPMDLYESQVSNWSENYVNIYYKSPSDIKKVCSFDLDEESKRNEPWLLSPDGAKKNLDMFLSGGVYVASSLNGVKYNYSDKKINGWGKNCGFIEEYKDSKFRESIGEYTFDDTTDTGLVNSKEKKKRVIIYTLYEE